MKRHATLVGGCSETWPDQVLVTSKAKPYPNGGVTLFISGIEILRNTNTMIETADVFADVFADQKVLDRG